MNKLNRQPTTRRVIPIPGTLYILIFIYFLTFGKHIFPFQENSFLLIYKAGYLLPYLSIPGGITELAGKLMAQFYFHPFTGALTVTTVILLPAVLLYLGDHRNGSGNLVKFGLLFLIPSLLLLLLQSYYYHLMEYNTGFVFVAGYFYLVVYSRKKGWHFLPVWLFPLFYYITGGYTHIFTCMYVMFQLVNVKGMKGVLNSLLMLVVATATLLVFKEFIFLQSYKILLTHPLPAVTNPAYKAIYYILIAFTIFYPLLSGKNLSVSLMNKRRLPEIVILLYCVITCIGLFRLHNPQVAQAIELQETISRKDWGQAIQKHEATPSRNLIGQYFYNIALAETGQLCNRLFFGKQDFGPGSLILPWQNEHLNWGAQFYYTVGLCNEAQRWAYEEFIVYGPKPQNIELLARTNIINGNHERATKYIHLLKHTLNYRQLGLELEKLNNDTGAIAGHIKFQEKINNLPKDDFFVDVANPQNNIQLLLKSNPCNTKALEYQMAWYLLAKDLNAIVSNIGRFKDAGFTYLPVHIEEALLAYENSTNIKVDLEGILIREQTLLNFRNYISSYKRFKAEGSGLQEKMAVNFGKTFWYYYHFS